jgi:hypothetical protein
MKNAKKLLIIYYVAFFCVVVLGKVTGAPVFASLTWATIFIIGCMPVIATVGIGFLIFLFLCVWYAVNDPSKWEE